MNDKPMPVYKGERVSRSDLDKEIILCRRCSRFATHGAERDVPNGAGTIAMRVYFCDWHLNEAIKERSIYGVRVFGEYRRHLHRYAKWLAAQPANAGVQGAML